ncbi:DUF973 family protein [Stygiolobus caldivivus]|uniref:DUF973 family protein n=1 Tax=Stygiolobus caldivivus TaxID=2824673 RepID=A0A8D5U6L5_9CREN|nr:DUF973 family protein [Stygiolobus caldivivus]BCU70197.1 hypothetical protein KN1_14940 [Stygiolobus caldivivus]
MKNKYYYFKGVSDVTTVLILVVAFIIIVLIFLGLFFGLLHPPATAKAVGTGMLVCSNNYYIAYFYMKSNGNLQIDSATIYGTNINALNNATLTNGENTIELIFPTSPQFIPQEGETYQVIVGLSNGENVQVTLVFLGNTPLPSPPPPPTSTSTVPTTSSSSPSTTTNSQTTSTSSKSTSTTTSTTSSSSSTTTTSSTTSSNSPPPPPPPSSSSTTTSTSSSSNGGGNGGGGSPPSSSSSSSSPSSSSQGSSSSSSPPPIIAITKSDSSLVNLIPAIVLVGLAVYYSRNFVADNK